LSPQINIPENKPIPVTFEPTVTLISHPNTITPTTTAADSETTEEQTETELVVSTPLVDSIIQSIRDNRELINREFMKTLGLLPPE
jgi:hypothetical protein